MELKDVIRFYLGCDGIDREGKRWLLTDADIHGGTNWNMIHGSGKAMGMCENIKPLLRKLSSMTEEEIAHIGLNLKAGTQNASDIKYWLNSELVWTVKHLTPKVFYYLIKQGFDLFGLIERKQAIDINAKTEQQ